VAKDWNTLKTAAEEMKGDRELCMAAVAQNKWALKWVRNREAAVAQDWEAIDHMSDAMKDDWGILLVAFQHLGYEFTNLRQSDMDYNVQIIVSGLMQSIEKNHNTDLIFQRWLSKEMQTNGRVRSAAGK